MTTDKVEMPKAPPRRATAWARVSRLELVLAAFAGVIMVGLTLAEPDILEAPFENARTLLFTFGGTALAAVAFAFMSAAGVPPLIRVTVLGAPFVVVSWWLISPFFIDEKIEDRFGTSIAAARGAPAATPGPTTTTVPTTIAGSPLATAAAATVDSAPPDAATPGPVLLAAGSIVGLAGHDGTGDAGIFRTDGSHRLRLENLDIDNGPDLHLYLLPGADRVSPDDPSLYLGPLRGNVGNLTYDLPNDFQPTTGPWTVLVWCEAFDVEFVGATLTIN